MKNTRFLGKLIFTGFLFCLTLASYLYSQEDGGTIEDARILFEEALKHKKKGESEKAVKTFERALRTNRGILSEDDMGLISELRSYYTKKLEKNPNDLELLETMGFISAVCDSDLKKAIEYYADVESKTKDEGEKTRLSHTLERLRAQYEAIRQNVEDVSAKIREERLKGWAEMEKQDALAAQSEAKSQLEGKISELYRRKDDLSARIPQLEDELKDAEAEEERSHRMYYATNDRRYRRKENRAEELLTSKRNEIERTRKELEKSEKEIEELTKKAEEMEKKSGQGGKTGTDTSTTDTNGQQPSPDSNPADTTSGTSSETSSDSPSETSSENSSETSQESSASNSTTGSDTSAESTSDPEAQNDSPDKVVQEDKNAESSENDSEKTGN
ncbi:MAG: hypothetical protein HQM10_19030 [Candidatus Riflebacteria bacterium]|nr:hypothetical protein [Candidatus Riflebacteria bacterium]